MNLTIPAANWQKLRDSQVNPASIDLLNRLAQTEKISEELDRLKSSPEVDKRELYLQYVLSGSSGNEIEKLVFEWMTTTLSFSNSYNLGQEIVKFNRALGMLDFKHAFSLAAAAYRIALLSNEQSNPYATLAFAATLEKLIQEHPIDYQALNLSDLSLKSQALHFDVSTAPLPFLIELREQQKALKHEKTALVKLVGIGLLSAAAITGMSYAAAKNLIADSPLPPTTLLDHVNNHLGKIIAVAIGSFVILGTYFRFKEKKVEQGAIVSLSLSEIKTILAKTTDENDFSSKTTFL